MEHVQILEELFIQNGILFDPYSIEEPELAYENVTSQTISSLQLALEELLSTNVEVRENLSTLWKSFFFSSSFFFFFFFF